MRLVCVYILSLTLCDNARRGGKVDYSPRITRAFSLSLEGRRCRALSAPAPVLISIFFPLSLLIFLPRADTRTYISLACRVAFLYVCLLWLSDSFDKPPPRTEKERSGYDASAGFLFRDEIVRLRRWISFAFFCPCHTLIGSSHEAPCARYYGGFLFLRARARAGFALTGGVLVSTQGIV